VAIEEIGRMPAVGGLFRRAIAGMITGRSGADRLTHTELVLRGVGVDRDHLRRYGLACGFRLSDTLPATYPHVCAFPLALDLMTREDFPLPLVGLVHIQNTIEQVRPVNASELMDFAVRAENLRDHARGRAVDLVATAAVDGSVVWRGRSAYLRKAAKTSGRDQVDRSEVPEVTAVWRVDAGVARAYAEVSGDRNPIHTSTLAARAFGFPRRIAHGMWSKARCLASLEGRLPDQFTVDAGFKLPILLPATVTFSSARDAGGGWRFALNDAKSGRPHLTGSVVT